MDLSVDILNSTWALVAPAVGGAGGLLVLVGRKGRRAWQRGKELAERWAATMDKVDVMHATLGPNGGRSLADQIARIEANGKRTDARVAAVTHASEAAIWETDARGGYVRVNRAYEDLLATSNADVVEKQWIALLDPVDRDRVVREWEHAVADRRRFETVAVFSVDGVTRRLRLSAEPMRTVDAEIIGWLGQAEAVSS